jgi:N6-adenosine-specific RNA methylase IME4
MPASGREDNPPATLFQTIAVDPPWPFEWAGGGAYRRNGRGEQHLNHRFKKGLAYPTMSVEEIAAFPVGDLAPPDAHLYLWIPDCHLIEGHGAQLARAWGFEPGRLIIWKKRGYGLGKFPRPQHESLLVCRRGSLAFRVTNVGSVHEWKQPYENGTRKHSAKPEGAYDLIERASPGPYLELFARRARLGWSYWGNEALQTVEMPEQSFPPTTAHRSAAAAPA